MGKPPEKVHAIISPPRASSTALARAFWHQPSIRFYAHEPFELHYYEGAPLSHALESIEHAVDLRRAYPGKGETTGHDLLIKEMTFQVADLFPQLVAIVNTPLIFLIRDPRLTIASRIKKIAEAGKQKINFPLVETGWQDLKRQVSYCERAGKEYVVVEASDFRNHPERLLKSLFRHLDLPFSIDMLNWAPAPTIKLDNLDGIQSHFYTRVLSSTTIEPATEPIPPLEDFSARSDLREHVQLALAIYRELLHNKNRLP